MREKKIKEEEMIDIDEVLNSTDDEPIKTIKLSNEELSLDNLRSSDCKNRGKKSQQ